MEQPLSIPVKKTSTKTKPAKVGSTLSLARYLGLSEWTVSRAINGHPEVKAATRERILKAMEEVGFRPNPVARGLSGKAMGIVGVCFGNAHSGVMIDKITLLDQFLRQHDLRGILSISSQDEASELRILADFLHLRVDAIVLIQSVLATAQIQKLLDGALCVHVDPANQDILPRVSLDRDKAMHLIVDHLFELGHRSIGALGFSALNVWRWKGLVEALIEHGLSPERNLQAFELEDRGSESYAEGKELVRRALAAKKRPTAFIAVNDRVAAGAMQELRDQGLRVPEDFSVVGFDNLTVGRHLRPTLTTIDQQPQLLITQAGELLLEQLGKSSGPSLGKCITVEPRLIIRESTGPVPVGSRGKR
jgi:DNA-binding LacI/PurR family transcriptional regulator